jgi:hypothetical protein
MDETEHDLPAFMDLPRLTGCVLAGVVVAGQSALLHSREQSASVSGD